jgi:hypothetical protein
MSIIVQDYVPRRGASGKRFDPMNEPVEVVSYDPPVFDRILEIRVENASNELRKWEIARMPDGSLSVTAEGCRMGYLAKKGDEPSRIVGDALLFAPGNLWDNEPEGYILAAYNLRR